MPYCTKRIPFLGSLILTQLTTHQYAQKNKSKKLKQEGILTHVIMSLIIPCHYTKSCVPLLTFSIKRHERKHLLTLFSGIPLKETITMPLIVLNNHLRSLTFLDCLCQASFKGLTRSQSCLNFYNRLLPFLTFSFFFEKKTHRLISTEFTRTINPCFKFSVIINIFTKKF